MDENIFQLRSGISFGVKDGVDRKKDAIYGIAVVSKGEAKGHNILIDDQFLDDFVFKCKNRTMGLKCRFGHPNASSTALGTYLGRVRNIRRDNDVIRGDLFLDKSSHSTPNGDLGKYVMDLAESDPYAFGSSIVYIAERVWKDKKDKYPTAVLKEVFGCDVVDEPAANSGIFSAFDGTSVELSAKFTQFLDKFLAQPDSVKQVISFLQRYNDNREYYKQDSVSCTQINDTGKQIPENTTTTEHAEETIEFIEETDDYIHVPVPGQEGNHKGHKIRTIVIQKKRGISAKYCVDCKKIVSYTFRKDEGWTKDTAKKWVRDHNKEKNEALSTISIDGLEMIEDVGLGDAGQSDVMPYHDYGTVKDEDERHQSQREKEVENATEVEKPEVVMVKCAGCEKEVERKDGKCSECGKEINEDGSLVVAQEQPAKQEAPTPEPASKPELTPDPEPKNKEETEVVKLRKENFILKMEKQVDSLIEAGRITPALREKAVSLLGMAFEDEALKGVILDFMTALPVCVQFGNEGKIDPTEVDTNPSDKAYADVQKYAEEHRMSFEEALRILRAKGKVVTEK